MIYNPLEANSFLTKHLNSTYSKVDMILVYFATDHWTEIFEWKNYQRNKIACSEKSLLEIIIVFSFKGTSFSYFSHSLALI